MSEKPLPSNAFTRMLHEIRNGDAVNEASMKLQKLISAVRDTGRGGKITVSLEIEPAARGVQEGGVSQIFMHDEITVKIPEKPKKAAFFFTTEDGGLTRKDPNQIEMDLKVVADNVTPLKEVKTA